MKRAAYSVLLTLIALLVVGWPPRARVNRPALGLPVHGRQDLVDVTLSLPFFVPGDLKRRLADEQFDDVSWTLDGLQSRRSHSASVPHPKDASGLWKVVHIADLPPPGRNDLLKAFLSRMTALKPDLVLASGDLGYGDTEADWDRITGFFNDWKTSAFPW